MGINVQARGKRHQLRVTHKLLGRPFFATFDTESEANSYGQQLHALLERGIVPAELLSDAPRRSDDKLLVEIIRAYSKAAPITDSDSALLGHMLEGLAGVRESRLTYDWVQGWVRDLKMVRNLAPSSVRKRVGVMGRVLDWYILATTPPGQTPRVNVFRLLPSGYSVYTRAEAAELERAAAAAAPGALVVLPKEDQVRDRRQTPDEEAAILRALAGVKRPDRERPLEPGPEFIMLYHLVLDTGLRLLEAYRQRVEKVDLARGLLDVDGSKGRRGLIKPRNVPLKPRLAQQLAAFIGDRKEGRLFSFWDGTPEDVKRCTGRLSARFRVLFEYAGVRDFTEHDLRHEATCRWVELRDAQGRWVFSDVEICRIMGWTDTRMMLRYASLRGEDLADRLRGLPAV
jgi:integrase